MAKKKASNKPAPPRQPTQPSTEAQPQTTQQEQALEELGEPKELSSSMVATAAWSNNELEIVFQSGSEENYRATEAEARELLAAPSPGKWMWQHYAPHGSRAGG